MSQQQPMSDQQPQSGPTAPPYDNEEVPSSQQKVDDNPVGDQVNGPANDQGRPLGTEVMGDPAKPADQQTRNFDRDSNIDNQRGGQFAGGQGQNTPAAGNPYVQQPASTIPANQQAQESANPPSQQAQGANPYVQTASTENAAGAGKGPMDNLHQVLNNWSKGFTGNAGHVWTHLSTGPNMTETALGRLSVGTKVLSEGGLVNVFKKEFPPVSDNEQLLKTYACYMSTSTGPVAGTLFLSTEKIAFGSDRPLSSSPQAGGRAQSGVEQPKHFYKVAVPLDKVQAINPRDNPKKVSEKYIQLETTDQHEFWFLGFVNYDKAVKNLQETVNGAATNMQPNASDRPEGVTDAQSNMQPNAKPNASARPEDMADAQSNMQPNASDRPAGVRDVKMNMQPNASNRPDSVNATQTNMQPNANPSPAVES